MASTTQNETDNHYLCRPINIKSGKNPISKSPNFDTHNKQYTMKKILFLLITVALTVFSYDASAQKSKLLGTWSMNISGTPEEGLKGLKKTDFQFESDKTGKFILEGKLSDTLPDTEYKMFMDIKLVGDFTWSLTDNSLEIDFKSVDLNIENFTLTPQTKESELLSAMLQAGIAKELENNKEALQAEFLKEAGVLEDKVEIEFIDKDTFKFKDEDEVIFKRVK